MRRGVIAGTMLAVAAVAYGRHRSRSDSARREPPAATEREGAAFLVRRRVDPAELESLRAHVAGIVSAGDPEPVLGLEEATTASLFLDLEGAGPELVWYGEVPRSVTDRWDEPRSTVAEAFPVDHEAVEFADESVVDRELLVHAANPARPRTVASGDGSLVTGPDGAAVDVDLVRMRLRPGLPERVADGFAGFSRRVVDGNLELGPIERWSAEMLDAENMYTESVFLERRADGYALVGYMEAEEMARVYDAYYDTENPVARGSEIVLGRVLEAPETILEYPLETDVELLAHAIAPDRPRRLEEW
ncbi:DUF6176 family protein [Natronobeatus ordinarius]|uniref:DUF6176 family protein n=1 Tax=Natronobeatus ordinarius TaxID=2963433 RepID=UPI0020CBB9BF|nr:DUF6176 family protein [Natronobeatus ordinarius]